MSLTLASQIKYSKLCEIYESIQKSRGNKKIDELRKFFDECRREGEELKAKNLEADITMFPIMRLFLPGADRERGPYGLKEKSFADLLIHVFCLGKNNPDSQKLKNYKAPEHGESGMGDFAEAFYWVMKKQHSNIKCTMTIEELNTALDSVARRHEENKSKNDVFLRLVNQLGLLEWKWLIRTILKDLKLSMGQKKVFDAYHPDAETLFSENSNLRTVCDTLIDRDHRIERNLSNIVVLSPFKPMLLERCKIEDVGKFFTDNDVSYFVQTKYDGERSQIHMKNGTFKYYTRHGTDITNNSAYGDSRNAGGFLTRRIASLLHPDCRSIILDGELMGWDKNKKILGSKGGPFDVKTLTATNRHQPCFVAFDLVMYNDKLLVNVPYKDRLHLLDTAFREAEGVLMRSTLTKVSTSDELLKVFNKSLDTREEGIVLKISDGLYKPNTREGSGCYKIKAEYSENLIQDIDLVILGGYYGEGKYAGMFNTFLTGVVAPSEYETNNAKKFYSVVSVSTGLSIEKLKELEVKFKAHWSKQRPDCVIGPKKNQPDAWIHPKNSVVLQLRATELTRCSVHPAGYTLRFPRVVKVRNDKPCEDAWTLKELRDMVKDGGFVQKVTKRHATSSDIRSSSAPKIPRNVRPAPMRVDTKYLGILPNEVPKVTRLLQGKEFCVVNGEETLQKPNRLTKIDIQKMLHMHAAKVVQNPGPKTFGIIVGNPKTERVKNLINCKKWDVVSLDWLRRITKEENWSKVDDWCPWEIVCSRESTANRFVEQYDEFYDSYTRDADKESIDRSLKMTESLIQNTEISIDEREQLEKELFENGISPFSLFTKIVGYFDDSSDCKIHDFTFMRGTIRQVIDESVTHVFVNGNAINLIELYSKINDCGRPDIKIINSKWIEDCCKEEKLIKLMNYVIA